MRFIAALVVLAAMGTCHAANVRSIEEGWAYLTKLGKSDQWVVVASKKNDGYVQCANFDGEFVRCEFPIWLKAPAKVERVAPRNSQGTPHREVPGTQTREYMSAQQVAVLKSTLQALDVEADDTYSQVVDENERTVGTSYDVRVVLEMSFSGFDRFVESILEKVWQTSRKDGYAFETDE